MPNWDDDQWIIQLVEQATRFPVEYLSSTPECSGMGNPILCLVIDGRYHEIPVDRIRHNPSSETVVRWIQSLEVA